MHLSVMETLIRICSQGLTPTVMKAVVASAITFATYEVDYEFNDVLL
jgi:hypothetical protein